VTVRDRLRVLLESGELHRLARESTDRHDFAQRLGTSWEAYTKNAQRYNYPGWDELRGRWDGVGFGQQKVDGILATTESGQLGNDFDGEEPTLPNIPRLGIDIPNAGIEHEPSAVVQHDPSVPAGHYIKGESTLYDEDGNVRLKWVKTNVSQQQRLEGLLAALPSITEPFRGFAEPVKRREVSDDDLLAVYVMGDPHLGMHAWHEETGDNFDLEIAERDLVDAVDELVRVAEPARRAVILSLGDFFHFDNSNVTTTAGTRQDGDTRWSKVFRSGIRAMRRLTDRALEKHELVEDIVVPGNHDWHTSTAMAHAIEQFYEREPRVTVNTSPDPFKWVRFGKVLIMTTHGDEAKAERLMGVMACDRAKDWGETEHRHILCGHVHHSSVKELPGCTVETFPTLAPKDRWHHGKGYRSQQTMCVDTFHREWGRINRRIIGIRQLRALQEAKVRESRTS